MIETTVKKVRKDLDASEREVKELVDVVVQDPTYDAKSGEHRGDVIGNLVLARRHIEDARMRLGKVYQARNGGVSNSDR